MKLYWDNVEDLAEHPGWEVVSSGPPLCKEDLLGLRARGRASIPGSEAGRPAGRGWREAGGARNHLKSLKVALFALFATFSDF